MNDSIKLIERWGKILAGRVLMAGTKPLKAAPQERDLVTDIPETYITAWRQVFNFN